MWHKNCMKRFASFLCLFALCFTPVAVCVLPIARGQSTPQPVYNAQLPVPVANGGTGSTSQTFVDLTTNQTIAGTKTFSGSIQLDDLQPFADQANGALNCYFNNALSSFICTGAEIAVQGYYGNGGGPASAPAGLSTGSTYTYQTLIPNGFANGTVAYCGTCIRSTTPCAAADAGFDAGAFAFRQAGQWVCPF